MKKKKFYLDFNKEFKQFYDSRGFWKLVRKLRNSDFVCNAEIEGCEWFTYFNDLLNPPLNVDRINYAAPLVSVPHLDEPFNMAELNYVLKKAKDGKAPGPERVPNEFFKNCPRNFFELLGDSASVPISFGRSVI